jgi:CMP-N-acetylneuraminic acid synthetase
VRTLGVITARGGSKGVPGKNIKLLRGRPLIAYTIEAANESNAFDRLILSTDDPEIAEVARRFGCDVPFLRPPSLARDETPHLPVMQHAVEWLAEHESYQPDAVMILQPTSPLRQSWHVRGALELLSSSGADSVVSVSAIPAHVHPMRALTVNAAGEAALLVTGEPVRRRINRRQELPPAWAMNGAIYLFRASALRDPEPSLYGNRSFAFVMSHPYGLSIDDLDDWIDVERGLDRLANTDKSDAHGY